PDERPVAVARVTLRLIEAVEADAARIGEEVVLADFVAVAVVGMTAGALPVVVDALDAGRQVLDDVVLAVDPVDVFLDEQIAAALVDLTFVEVATRGEIPVAAGGLTVDAAAEHGPGVVALAQRERVHRIVVARVHLPDDFVRAKL